MPLMPHCSVHQERRPFNFIALDDLTSERVFLQNEFAYGTDGRSNVGFGFWQTCAGSKAPLNKANYEAAVSAMMGITSSKGEPLWHDANTAGCRQEQPWCSQQAD